MRNRIFIILLVGLMIFTSACNSKAVARRQRLKGNRDIQVKPLSCSYSRQSLV